jgi:hypothetical protein
VGTNEVFSPCTVIEEDRKEKKTNKEKKKKVKKKKGRDKQTAMIHGVDC